MEEKELNEIRKLIIATTTAKKAVKDIKTSILQDLSEESDNDCKKEYFRMIKRLMKLRSRLARETNLSTDKETGKTVVNRIDTILESPVPSPEPRTAGLPLGVRDNALSRCPSCVRRCLWRSGCTRSPTG